MAKERGWMVWGEEVGSCMMILWYGWVGGWRLRGRENRNNLIPVDGMSI